MRRIFLTENQVNLLRGAYSIEPKKVLLVKKFLDASFTPDTYEYIGNTGTIERMPTVSMMDSSGNPIRKMTDKQLYQLLRSEFNEKKHLFANKNQTDKFLQVVMKAWYNNDITSDGLIKHVNNY